jgi:hypothetical protein
MLECRKWISDKGSIAQNVSRTFSRGAAVDKYRDNVRRFDDDIFHRIPSVSLVFSFKYC